LVYFFCCVWFEFCRYHFVYVAGLPVHRVPLLFLPLLHLRFWFTDELVENSLFSAIGIRLYCPITLWLLCF
jgi:hypothetical protein